jgi:hypothetical protein
MPRPSYVLGACAALVVASGVDGTSDLFHSPSGSPAPGGYSGAINVAGTGGGIGALGGSSGAVPVCAPDFDAPGRLWRLQRVSPRGRGYFA